MFTPQFLEAIYSGIKKNSTQSYRLEVIFESRAMLEYAVHTKTWKNTNFCSYLFSGIYTKYVNLWVAGCHFQNFV